MNEHPKNQPRNVKRKLRSSPSHLYQTVYFVVTVVKNRIQLKFCYFWFQSLRIHEFEYNGAIGTHDVLIIDLYNIIYILLGDIPKNNK